MLEVIEAQFPKLRGYTQHGVTFSRVASETQAVGLCPFCHGRDKFYAHVAEPVWDCKRCGKHGNFVTFLTEIAAERAKQFKGLIATSLAKDRGLPISSLRAWGIGWSGTHYTVPAHGNPQNHVTDIERYRIRPEGERRGYSTSGATKCFYAPVKRFGSQIVWIAEGPWDGITMSTALLGSGHREDVYATQGANAFPLKYADTFFGKDVVVCLDNDDAGRQGAARIQKLIGTSVRSIRYLCWPEGLAEGYDVRDLWIRLKDPTKFLNYIHKHLGDAPEPTVEAKSEAKVERETVELTGAGLPRNDVVDAYRKWLHLPNVEVLDVLFGSIFANRIEADPLWIFFVAPPGGSKSELLMSLHDAPLIYATTSLTPKTLVSGASFAGGGDPSLLPKLDGRVLVIKDFTTILSLQSNSRDEILGTLRDAYDGETEKDFGSGITRKIKSRFGIAAGVTPVIDKYAAFSGVLGERFLKYRIRQPGHINVGADVITRALMNISREGKMRSGLRETAKQVLNRPIDPEDIPEVTADLARRLMRLAQWVAGLRGVVDRERYTGLITFKPVSEIGTRLAKQLCTLALGISVFRGDKTVTPETFQIVCKVARDTAPDRVEELIRQLYVHRRHDYATTGELSEWTRFPEATIRMLLQDLELLRITRRRTASRRGYSSDWRLAQGIVNLIEEVGIFDYEVKWAAARTKRRT